uniref:PPUP8324 n=1 Tax=Poeciliopsis prolifica TaxID=188132 RepID=A0A0S7EQ61_9TELE
MCANTFMYTVCLGTAFEVEPFLKGCSLPEEQTLTLLLSLRIFHTHKTFVCEISPTVTFMSIPGPLFFPLFQIKPRVFRSTLRCPCSVLKTLLIYRPLLPSATEELCLRATLHLNR